MEFNWVLISHTVFILNNCFILIQFLCLSGNLLTVKVEVVKDYSVKVCELNELLCTNYYWFEIFEFGVEQTVLVYCQSLQTFWMLLLEIFCKLSQYLGTFCLKFEIVNPFPNIWASNCVHRQFGRCNKDSSSTT